MSKELAKVFWILLGKHLEAYEEQFNEIVLPKPRQPTKEEKVLASASRRKKK
jgi:hypothetical protein